MAFKLSTGLRRALLSGAAGLDQILDGGFLHIYSGTAPETADGEITGALLATIYRNDGVTAGLGLQFELGPNATDAYIRKVAADTWNNAAPNGANVGAGTQTATHFVLVGPGAGNEDGELTATKGASTTAVRILGSVGVQNADLNLSSTSLTSGEVQAINSFNISIPETF